MIPDKLYLVVRSDLSPGDVLCQATHAAVDWTLAFPERAGAWHPSNYLVILAVPDEAALLATADLLAGFDVIVVSEPDLEDEHTALAVEHAAGRLLSSLPLAFREHAMT